MRAPLLIVSIVAAAAGALLGSGGPHPDAARWQPGDPSQPFPRRFADCVVLAPPQRVLAASILSAEVLLAVLPHERIAGLHELAADARFCAGAADAVAAGLPLVRAEPEALLSVRPDLIVVDQFTSAETRALLRFAGVPVLQTLPIASLDDVVSNLRLLGHATGNDRDAGALLATLQQRLQRVRDGAPARSGWRVLQLNGALETYGRGSLFDDLVCTVGAENVAATLGAGPYRKLDIETVLAANPNVLVVSTMPGSETDELARLQQDRGLQLLDCVQRGRILLIPFATIGATSQHVADCAERIAAQLDRWGPP